MIGTTVGSYRVTQKVSVGGMGTVYKAEHILIGKHAAVKVLHPELRSNQEVVNRFFNEAKATTQIKHPGIVEIFDFGYLETGDGFIVMEFLEGMSLAQRLTARGAMPDGEAAMILRGVCSALAAAHAKKIIHRDLKPDNVFLCPDPDSATGERPKLLDFGIAKLSDAALTGSTSATKTGMAMGTPTYMSPEQCRGAGEVDHRSDLYSIGCMFYEMVTGNPPFVADGAGELIGAHLFVVPQPPSSVVSTISPEADKLILELLDKKPENRPQSAKELGQRLTAIAQHTGWITRMSPSGVTGIDRQHQLERSLATPVPEGAAATPERAATPAPQVTSQPTTLTLAASQSVADLGRTRKRTKTVAAIGAGVAVLALSVGFVAMKSGGSEPPAAPAVQPTQPEVRQPAPSPATAPARPPEATAPTPRPAPEPPAIAAPTPPPAPPATPPPAPTTTAKTVKATHPHPTTPPVTAIKKKPPPTSPTGAGSGSGSGSAKILIESDLN
jgi:serine/threonine-protein kinase